MLKIWIFMTIAVIPLVTAGGYMSAIKNNYFASSLFATGTIPKVKPPFLEIESPKNLPCTSEYIGGEEEDPYRLYGGQCHFSISMLKSMKKKNPGKNHIFSTHSALQVLLVTYLAVRLDENVKKSLKLGMSLPVEWAKNEIMIGKAYIAEKCERPSRFVGSEIIFKSVNKLYYSDRSALEQDTLKYLGDSINRVDFSQPGKRRDEINDLVQNITGIEKFIPDNFITPETISVIVNAAYFEGLWPGVNRFTRVEPNHLFNDGKNSTVDMMSVTARFDHGVLGKEKATYLDMPYHDDRNTTSMLVFLPNDNTPTAVDDLIRDISAETIKHVVNSGSHPENVDVKLPKMKFDKEYKLKETFKTMGIQDIPFSDVIHKAKIVVNEKGTTAAAATAAEMSRAWCDNPPKFHCDHPFIFMIYDWDTHDVLFVGVYRGPTH